MNVFPFISKRQRWWFFSFFELPTENKFRLFSDVKVAFSVGSKQMLHKSFQTRSVFVLYLLFIRFWPALNILRTCFSFPLQLPWTHFFTCILSALGSFWKNYVNIFYLQIILNRYNIYTVTIYKLNKKFNKYDYILYFRLPKEQDFYSQFYLSVKT